jgi:hypothetical protein
MPAEPKKATDEIFERSRFRPDPLLLMLIEYVFQVKQVDLE